MASQNNIIVDAHVHVGLIGDTWPHLGHMLPEYRETITYKVFLKYAKVDERSVCDEVLRELTIEHIKSSRVDKVVLLALDPVHDKEGVAKPERSNVWVANEYVEDLCALRELRTRALYGCSVHPYDRHFEKRIRECVDKEAVLVKWLPSAQQFSLADDIVKQRMIFLATAGPEGRPLPLLLHNGPEYAIPSTDERTQTFDFLNWTLWDDVVNFWRFGKKWIKPDVHRIHRNIRAALGEGAVIIFAHCGLPYFFGGFLGSLFEHSEFSEVRQYLQETEQGKFKGKALADVSAIATPVRKAYFGKIKKLPPSLLLYGSDFPTPAFELSNDLGDMYEDFKAVLKGDLLRAVVPEDNLLDVNLRELERAFPAHPMFYNFARHFLR